MDQSAIEDLFERNADMRLLEFRHSDGSKTSPTATRAGSSFGAESIVSSMPDAELEPGPRLRVAIAAVPNTGVIPGAIVGVAIDVFNDGNAPAPEAKLLLSLPIESEFRSGTLRIDGRETQAPEQMFAQGLPIARLPNATSTKVTFQLAILPGVNTLYLQPRLQSNGVPVVGTSGISIKRGSLAGTGAEAPAARPFYELEDDEIAGVMAETAEPIMPPLIIEDRAEAAPPKEAPIEAAAPPPPVEVAQVIPSGAPQGAPVEGPPPTPAPEAERAPLIAAPANEPPPRATKPIARDTKPRAAKPKPIPATAAADAPAPAATAAPAPVSPAPVAPAPAAAAPLPLPLADVAAAPAPARPAKARLAAPAASDERMIRYRALGASDIALLDRLFTQPAPGIIAHYVMISSIACSEPASGDDTSGFNAFLRRDIELLGRALVHSRMGKLPQYRVAQSDLNSLALSWQVAPQSFPPQRRLRRDLVRSELNAIGALLQPSDRDATLRTRIALLTLAASSVDGVDHRAAEECAAALSVYRSSVLAWLVPLCVASASSESFEIPAPSAAVDAAGRHLAASLKTALTA